MKKINKYVFSLLWDSGFTILTIYLLLYSLWLEFCTFWPPSFNCRFFFPFIFISWRLVTLQYCSVFCHTYTLWNITQSIVLISWFYKDFISWRFVAMLHWATPLAPFSQENYFLIKVLCMCVRVLSHVWLFVTLWIVSHQAPVIMGYFMQEN